MAEIALPAPEEAIAVAKVYGEPMWEMPKDLYIPPDALAICLDAFEGPLDLLLYLIKKQNVDILNIPVAEITRQYLAYMELMTQLQLELAAEYLVMAAMLAELKSRLLLPRPPAALSGEEGDPRAELVRRLQEYERCKLAAAQLDELPRLERDLFAAAVQLPEFMPKSNVLPEVSLTQLMKALAQVVKRAKLNTHHQVGIETLSVRERMSQVLVRMQEASTAIPFVQLFSAEEGAMGVVVTLLALLELLRNGLIHIIQSSLDAPIYVQKKDAA